MSLGIIGEGEKTGLVLLESYDELFGADIDADEGFSCHSDSDGRILPVPDPDPAVEQLTDPPCEYELSCSRISTDLVKRAGAVLPDRLKA